MSQSNLNITKPKLLLGCSGSVATLKVPEIVAELSEHFQIRIVGTENSLFFLERAENYNSDNWKRFEQAGGWDLCYFDTSEWEMWNEVGDKVLHIALRAWADVLLVAPASCNIIAKASVGISDNLLLSVMRAWDFSKPCIICPAMNTLMWDHPATSTALDILQLWGYEVLGPVVKKLACNETGNGALISVQQIVKYVTEKQGIGPRLSSLVVEDDDLIPASLSTPRRSPKPSASDVPFLGQTHIVTSHINTDNKCSVSTVGTPCIATMETHSITSWTVMWNVERCFAIGLGAGLGLGIASTIMTHWLKQSK